MVWFGRALVARDAAAFCVAGVALGDIHFRFARQAWHKLTSTVVLRGRRGTNSQLLSFCVAGARPVSFLDGGQARVSRPDNEPSSVCPREPGL